METGSGESICLEASGGEVVQELERMVQASVKFYYNPERNWVRIPPFPPHPGQRCLGSTWIFSELIVVQGEREGCVLKFCTGV